MSRPLASLAAAALFAAASPVAFALDISPAPSPSPSTRALLLTPAPGEEIYASSLAVIATPPPDLSTPSAPADLPLSLPPPDQPADDFHLDAAYTSPFTLSFPAPPPGTLLTLRLQRCEGSLCHLPESFPLDPASPDGRSPTGRPPPASPIRETSRLVGHATVPQFLSFLSSASPDTPVIPEIPDSPAPSPPSRPRPVLPLLLSALLGGLLLNLTPCVLPMIPVNLAILGAGRRSSHSRPRRFLLGLAYALGMALSYGLLGALVVQTGAVFGAALNTPPAHALLALLFAALGLALLGRWTLDLSRFRPRAARPRDPSSPAPYPLLLLAALSAGALAALLAGACVAPVLVATLTLAASLHAAQPAAALSLPFALGIGMALPWPLLALGLEFLPRPGAWMTRLNRAFGVLLLLLAAYYAFLAVRPLLPRPAPDDPSLLVLDLSAPDAPPDPASAIATFADGRPVLLEFSARWCKVCALMHRTTLADPSVISAAAPYARVRILADDPSRPPASTFLKTHRVAGFPTYLLLSPPANTH